MATKSLQRLTSSPKAASAIIHLIGVLLHAASIAWIPYITNPLHRGFGSSFQFLTFIGLGISTITFVVGLLGDVFQSEQLFDLKNLLAVIAAPLEFLIAILYWSLYAIDPASVTPPGHPLPMLANLGYHAMPAIVLTVDLMLLSPPWTIKAYTALVSGSVFVLSYWAWLELCFSHNGWYPYPFLATLSISEKAIFCPVVVVLLTGSTMALKGIYGLINGNEELKKAALNPLKVD